MYTRKFIKKVHNAFDELNYHETKRLDFNKFEQSAVRTLTHSKELQDAIDAVRMYQFCLKKWNEIEIIFSRKLQLFNEYDYEGNSLISVVSDDDALGTYYITNGINKKVRELFVASHSFNEKMFALGFEKGRFTVYEDGNYYIKYSKMSSSKMKLFDKGNNCLCNIVLSKDLDIFLENNLTPYELVVYDDFIGIYDHRYIDSLDDTDNIDTNKLIASIEWDILDKNSDLGVAKLSLFTSDLDLEMLIFFASSTFLVFQKHMQAKDAMISFLASR